MMDFKVDLNPHGQSELTTVDFINLDINKRCLICSIGKESILVTINAYFHINMLGFKNSNGHMEKYPRDYGP